MKMKKFLIKVNGNQYEVEVEEILNQTASKKPVNSVTPAPIEAPAPKAPPAPVNTSTSSGTETVTAPMPGTILNVYVGAGDVVKKGKVLLVLEAMKMENELVSPVDGTIVSISAEKGKSVNAGDALVVIA